MVISRERLILLGVAGAAFALFALDRAFSGGVTGPASASAAVASPSTTSAPVVSVVATSNVAPSAIEQIDPNVRSLAQRLEAVSHRLPEQTYDAFITPEAWRPKGNPVVVATGNDFNPQLFARKHPVDAVFSSDGEAQAVVNSQVVRVGDERDGMRLQSIGDRWVDWAGNGVRVRVHVRNN